MRRGTTLSSVYRSLKAIHRYAPYTSIYITYTHRRETKIEHINFGRNRIFKKHAKEIAELLLSPHRRVISLCLDSTCLGRHGFITIMNAAAQSPYLTYLDMADTNFMQTDVSPRSSKTKRKRSRSKPMEAMNEYHRKEAVDSILGVLSSTRNDIQHLIIGHNRLSHGECRSIANAAVKRGLITLDLFGNDIAPAELSEIEEHLYENRFKISNQALNNSKKVPTCISSLIVNYSVHRSQALYRCFKWNPR
eukprot:571021_1